MKTLKSGISKGMLAAIRCRIFCLLLCMSVKLGLPLSEESRLRVFENRVLRRIFGSKRDEITGELRRLHSEGLHDLYCSPNIRKNEMGGECGTYRRQERCLQGFGGRPEGRRPLGRPRRRWENNIKMDLQEVGCGGTDWIELAHDRDRCEHL